MSQVWAILDTETGELKPTKRTVKEKEGEEATIISGKLVPAKKKFIKFYKEFPVTVSSYTHYLMILAKYLLKNSNILGVRHKNGRVSMFNIDHIAEIIGLSKRSTYRFLHLCSANGIIASGKFKVNGTEKECYVMNPEYMFNGYRVANETLDLFSLSRLQLQDNPEENSLELS